MERLNTLANHFTSGSSKRTPAGEPAPTTNTTLPDTVQALNKYRGMSDIDTKFLEKLYYGKH
jgi:hypothetical protein